ncbi:Small subunit (SSU) processome component [Pleosporales sp. CAS-2024a]
MPAAVAARPPKKSRAPPAKKAKLAQPPAVTRPTALQALVHGSSNHKPTAHIARVRNARSTRVDDTAVVVGGGHAGHGDVHLANAEHAVIDISSAQETDDETDEADDDAAAPAVNAPAVEEDRPADDEAADADELSFGERLRAQDADPAQESRIVDVESAFATGAEPKALAALSQRAALATPSIHTLGTVLTQALRTNDTDLLDSCLRNVDVDAIYATVERLPSPLVGNLLQKLAERLHKKPGRAGMLMVWVQWSLAAHGGYLASQPQLVKQLATLNKVLKERASGLQPLLSLKGRLDMLQAQLDLRRRNQRRAAKDDEEEAVIYVEGEDDYVSSAEESVDGHAPTSAPKRLRDDLDDDDDDDSSVDQMPTTQEVDQDSDQDSAHSDRLLDDEAEETDLDTGDDMSEPMSDDLDEGEGLSESEEEAKPARRSTAARAGLKSRR